MEEAISKIDFSSLIGSAATSQSMVSGEGVAGAFQGPVALMGVMLGMSLLPLLLIGMTSFVKLSVVFSILRNAIGAGQIPSGAISGVLAIALSWQIMSPVFSESFEAFLSTKEQISASADKNPSGKNLESSEQKAMLEPLVAAFGPFKSFLLHHSDVRERVFFAEFASMQAGKGRPSSGVWSESKESAEEDGEAVTQNCSEPSDGGENGVQPECVIDGESFFTLVPAFVLSELKEAFLIGFCIFLPFFVVDLVVANVLVGLGMMMLSPMTVSLPFKLILFVVCDGWFLLCRSLLLGYGG